MTQKGFLGQPRAVLKCMQIRYHALLGGTASIALIPVLHVYSAAFFASSVLCDADHYLDYICRNGLTDFSLGKAFLFHEHLFQAIKAPSFLGLNIIHTAEFLLLLAVLALWTHSLALWAVFGGVLLHLGTDLVYLRQRGALFKRALSVIEYVVLLLLGVFICLPSQSRSKS